MDIRDWELIETGSIVPYEPELEDIFSITFTGSKWQISGDLHYLMDRYDNDENEMDELIDTNISGHYFVFPNLKIKADLNNILDKTDAVFPGIPTTGIRYLFGFDLFF